MSIETIQGRAATLSTPFGTFSKFGRWTVFPVILGLFTCIGAVIYWRIRSSWKKAELLKIEQQQKARDILIVWKILAEKIDWTTAEKLKDLTPAQTLEKVREFSSWFNNNKRALDRIDNLSLREQSISFLPDELGQLAQLQTLQLEYNQLTELPIWIGSLGNLRSLTLDNNKIKTLPDSFRKLGKLEWLHMENTQLTHLPDWIGELTQLQRVFLSGNQLTFLPMSLTELPRLERIDIKNNKFADQPEVIAKLTRVQVVA
jgi:Leucine-rich repeat (LRR) protein